MTLHNALTFSAIIGAFFVAALVIAFTFSSNTAHGSVQFGNDYLATSTSSNGAYGGTVTGSRLLRNGVGTLGSVVITGANTGIINLYNATTSDITQRAANRATSTILIASFPASATAGTYTFDVQFTDGLFYDVIGGVAPTSTVTYR